jgi:hypothetical protein
MTKLQSAVDVAIEMVRDLEEFKRSSSKDAFRQQLREEFVRRSGAARLDEALVTAMTSLVPTFDTRHAAALGRPARTCSMISAPYLPEASA